jgi:hypothetical protein
MNTALLWSSSRRSCLPRDSFSGSHGCGRRRPSEVCRRADEGCRCVDLTPAPCGPHSPGCSAVSMLEAVAGPSTESLGVSRSDFHVFDHHHSKALNGHKFGLDEIVEVVVVQCFGCGTVSSLRSIFIGCCVNGMPVSMSTRTTLTASSSSPKIFPERVSLEQHSNRSR